ncbi:hypothetical protein [Streptomyces sp. NPDC048242]|uniref:hypothetical protein n=1 Tax=Streptomyces sp. NPDC048242 TaxID=3155026 RepID=UPI00343FCCE6
MKDEIYAELARIIPPQEAVIILRTQTGFPAQRIPSTELNAKLFWSEVRRLVDAGVMLDGERELILITSTEYPGNPVLRRARESLSPEEAGTPDGPDQASAAPQRETPTRPPTTARESPPEPEPGVRWTQPSARPSPGTGHGSGAPFHGQPTPTRPSPEPQGPHVVLIFVGRGHHPEFIQAVRETEDPSAQVLYVSANDGVDFGQVAVAVRHELAEDRIEALRRRLVQDGAAPDLEIIQDAYEHRPYLLEKLLVRGPDHQPFDFAGVPSITTVRDIAVAILSQYGSDTTHDRVGHRRRTVVDHLQPDGSFLRLDPSQSLHDAGVGDGDTLNVYPESTAGIGQLKLQAILRVREEIRRYEKRHENFTVLEMDDPDFPTEYEVGFRAPGFRPPGAGEPHDADPSAQQEHTVLIALGAGFPLQAPAAIWLTPIFHPNIARNLTAAPDGLVCLGALQGSYRPTLDFGQLCQILVDMARYRNYDVRTENEGGGGTVDRQAAIWARSERGQAMIAAIRGAAAGSADPAGDEGLRHRALRVRPSDEVGDAG